MISNSERKRRWRLILGQGKEDYEGEEKLGGEDQTRDAALNFVYGEGGRGGKLRKTKTWLKDIRKVFNRSTVAFLQKKAMDKYQWSHLLLEKEFLEEVVADMDLLAEILQLTALMDDDQKVIARRLVADVVKQIEEQLRFPMLLSMRRGLRQKVKTGRNQPDIHWHKTIQANLRHYQPEHKTIIPEIWKGYKRTTPALKHIWIVIDQSASMSESVIYSSIIGSIMASVSSISTKVILFDSDVADISNHIQDPVDVLMGAQLGGGTEIGKALTYVHDHLVKPRDTLMFLISDLEDTGDQDLTRMRFRQMVQAGVQCYNILAMTDKGHPNYEKAFADELLNLGIPYGYCSPSDFPELVERMLKEGN
jgi:hypothetical protein